MKLFFSFVLLVPGFYASLAQEPISVIGPAQESKTFPIQNSRIVQVSENGIFLIHEKGKNLTEREFLLEKYDHNFNPVFIKSLNENKGVMGDMIDVHSICIIKNKMYVFKEGFKKSITKSFINVCEVSPEGEVSSVIKELDNIPAEKVTQTANYSISISPDQSKIVLLTQFPAAKDVNERIKIKVFDLSFNELWSKEITYNHPSKGAYENSANINNEGVVYILKKMKGDKYSYYYNLYTCSQNGSKWIENKVNIDPNFISEILLKILSTGNAVVAGLYSADMKWQERHYGSFYFSVDTEGKVLSQKFSPFDDKTGTKTQAGNYLESYKIKDLMERKDGNLLLITEYHYHTTESKPSPTPGALPLIVNHEKYGDIVIYNFSTNGILTWTSTIQKFQYNKIDEGALSSFIHVLKDDQLLIFYNQVETLYWIDKNGDKQEYTEFDSKTYYKSFLLTVNTEGQVSNKIPLIKTYERVPFKMSVNPKLYYINEKNELYFMIEMLHHKRFALGKFQL